MREPIGKCPPFGYDTHTVGRPRKGKREGAGKRDGKTTFLSTDPRVKETCDYIQQHELSLMQLWSACECLGSR